MRKKELAGDRVYQMQGQGQKEPIRQLENFFKYLKKGTIASPLHFHRHFWLSCRNTLLHVGGDRAGQAMYSVKTVGFLRVVGGTGDVFCENTD